VAALRHAARPRCQPSPAIPQRSAGDPRPGRGRLLQARAAATPGRGCPRRSIPVRRPHVPLVVSVRSQQATILHVQRSPVLTAW